MRLILFIDSLGSGGAERQITLLARLLKQRGADAIVVTYSRGAQGHFFLPQLHEFSIAHIALQARSRFGRVLALRRILRQQRPDAVLAFKQAAALYAELAGLPTRTWRLVVSERSAVPISHKTWFGKLRQFHRFADAVVCNSDANRELVLKTVPSLRGKVHTIYNAVDLNYFMPGPAASATHDPLRIVVLASHARNKNLANVLKALMLLRNAQGSWPVRVEWYGGPARDLGPLEEGRALITAHRLDKAIALHPPIHDARGAYWSAGAAMLASLYEGLPNTVCEAMACGKPVLASNVSDNPRLVCPGESGFLFDPADPASIATTIGRFCSLSHEQRAAMGASARLKAQVLFSPQRIVERYLEVLTGLKDEGRRGGGR